MKDGNFIYIALSYGFCFAVLSWLVLSSMASWWRHRGEGDE